MIEIEISNEMLEKAEERLYKMERSAKVAFEELFPNLDFEEDFLQNQDTVDIHYLLDTVEKAVDERGYEHYGALYKLLEWTLEGRVHKLFRERDIETIRNFDEREIEEFITWLQESGLSYEQAQNSEIQIEMLGCFLNEREE